MHRERSGHAELCHCVLNWTMQVSCVVSNPLLLLVLDEEAGTAASFDQTGAVSGSCRPNAVSGLRNCPTRVPSVTPFQRWSERQQSRVQFALQSHTCLKTRERDGWVGRHVVHYRGAGGGQTRTAAISATSSLLCSFASKASLASSCCHTARLVTSGHVG